MKAVVLVGGEGTRLRPLTETSPKPLLPLANRPFLHHVLDHLGEHGVEEAVLSSPYLEEAFRPFLAERRGKPLVTWITEEEPLGTGGAIVNALARVDGTFLVLNGDILTDLDLTVMIAFHRERKAAATIALTPVEDARPYGLVDTDEATRVTAFREKPADPVPGNINAGTYVLELESLASWERGRTISVEREIFPAMIERGEPVHAFLSDAYWTDLGTPERYLQAHFDILDGRVAGLSFPAPLVAPTARVHLRAHLGKRVVLGQGVAVAEDAEVDDSVLHEGVEVGPGARVVGSILGLGSRVGAGAVVEDCVLAEGAGVPEGTRAEGLRLLPGEVAGTVPNSPA